MNSESLNMIKHKSRYGNVQRARVAAATLKAFTDATGSSGEDDTDLADLIANLCHYADAKGLNMAEAIARGTASYFFETESDAKADASALEKQS